jgi:predicted nuclease of predicted toxin-antitoxin system
VKILLDENLDWRLERFLPGHEVRSVSGLGWAGLKNGKLLARAAQ